MPTSTRKFWIGQGDTNPALLTELQDEDRNALDFSTGGPQPADSVDFEMVDEDGNTVIDEGAAFESKADGTVRYDWSDGETDTPGEYEAAFEVTYNSSRTETFPNSYKIIVVIEDWSV